MKYLGMEINGGIDIFENQKKRMKEKAETIAKNTYIVIERCCNNILIGKSFLKRSTNTLYPHGKSCSKPQFDPSD